MRPTKNISRKTIDRYSGATARDQHAIESNLADAFDSDALDGFTEMGVTTKQLKRLDKRFLRKSNFWILTLGFAIIAFGTSLYVLTTVPTKTPTQQKVSFIVEQTDIRVPESIQKLEPLALEEQITVQEIKAFQKNNTDNPPPFIDKPLLEEVISPHLDPLPIDIEHKEVAITSQLQAKEIYLSQLKAIDYSAYRQKQSIAIEQIILTGTPANIGDEQTIQDEPVIKTVQIPYMDYLNKTLGLINKGKWKQALSRLQEIISNYPDDVNARFYSGWCLYNLQDYGAASKAFSACLQLAYSNFNEEAFWYLALSKKANHETEEAKLIFNQIKTFKGYYSKAAEKELKDLK